MVARVSQTRKRRRGGAALSPSMVIVCVAVGFFAYSMGKGNAPTQKIETQRAFVPEFDAVDIPVPVRPVPAGTLVRDIDLRIEKFPEHQLPKGIIRELGAHGDSVTLVALPGGLPIVAGNIGSADELSNPVIGKIPPGMRAMTVHVDATAAVEGWARAGSVVDVLLVQKDKTTVVAERVRILSAEHSTSVVSDETERSIPRTVTLLVTQEQCLAINTAVPLGKIAFALRSNRDDDRWRQTHFSADELPSSHKEGTPARIAGVISVKNGKQEQRFALVDGSWIPTDSLPEGFLRRPDPPHESEAEQ